jgi:hypothetical protein
MRKNTIDSKFKKSDNMGMLNNIETEKWPRNRDNETVRREAPSEAREAFLDKCAASQYNNRNTEVRLWTTRLNLSVYQAEMQRSTQRIFPLETEAVGVNRLQ